MVFSEMTTSDALKLTKKKMTQYQTEFLERLNAIEVDAHWFRRAFHTFAASFLIYYILPDVEWIHTAKIVMPTLIVVGMILIEYYRLRGDFDHQRFFGLRSYEKKRPASYLYFGIAVLILFLFFPQQIAIPCILCACFTDPLIGETRHYLKKQYAYLLGGLLSALFFVLTWSQAEWWVILLVGCTGASGAVVGEATKLSFLDDDFLIQMLPALLLLLLWQMFLLLNIDILPPAILHPL